MENRESLERRVKQAELVKQWMPWAKSTGSQSAEGKAWVATNAWRGGHQQQLRDLVNSFG